jgi:hypothetical protein
VESGEFGRSFEDIIRDSWGEDPGRFEDSSGKPRSGVLQLPDGTGCERRPDGTWCESETGRPLEPDRSAWLEELWQEWAPRLPDEVRRAVESPGGGGDDAGVREPRRPLPTMPAVSAALPLDDDE